MPQDTPRPQPAVLCVDSGDAVGAKELEGFYVREPFAEDECHPQCGIKDQPFWTDESTRKTTQIYSTFIWVVMPPNPGLKKDFDKEVLEISKYFSTAF